MLKNFLNKIFRVFVRFGYSKKFYRNEQIIISFYKKFVSKDYTSSLDLGSGPNPKNPFNSKEIFGIDFRENPDNNVFFSDLSKGKLPFENEKFDYVTAYDLLEHIPRFSDKDSSFPLILLFNEIYRVLKKDGIFFSMQPVFPSPSAFQDPTHVNIMTEETIEYYFCNKAWARIYGFNGTFELLNDGWIKDKYFCFIKKIGNEEKLDLNFIQE